MIRAVGQASGVVILVILMSSQFAARFYSEPFLWIALGILAAATGSPAWSEMDPAEVTSPGQPAFERG